MCPIPFSTSYSLGPQPACLTSGLGVGSDPNPASLYWEMMWLTIGYAVNQMLCDIFFCFKPLWEGPGEMAGPCQHLAVVLEGEGQEELGLGIDCSIPGLVCKREFTSA